MKKLGKVYINDIIIRNDKKLNKYLFITNSIYIYNIYIYINFVCQVLMSKYINKKLRHLFTKKSIINIFLINKWIINKWIINIFLINKWIINIFLINKIKWIINIFLIKKNRNK